MDRSDEVRFVGLLGAAIGSLLLGRIPTVSPEPPQASEPNIPCTVQEGPIRSYTCANGATLKQGKDGQYVLRLPAEVAPAP
jgi:hypothetical protein